MSVWKLGVAICNITTSVGKVGEVGEVGSFMGRGREMEEEVVSLETGSLSLTHQLRKSPDWPKPRQKIFECGKLPTHCTVPQAEGTAGKLETSPF